MSRKQFSSNTIKTTSHSYVKTNANPRIVAPHTPVTEMSISPVEVQTPACLCSPFSAPERAVNSTTAAQIDTTSLERLKTHPEVLFQYVTI